MANEWLRLWHDMPNDPKWRTIARIAQQPIALVQAVYLHLLVDASRNVTRGHVDVTTEDLASALDVTEGEIQQVLNAMDGRVLSDGELTGWEKRQPKREDDGNPETGAKSAAQRKREQRIRNKATTQNQPESQGVTQCHDESQNVTLDKDKDKDKDKENKEKRNKKEKTSFGVQELISHGLSEAMATELFEFRKRKKAAISPLVWKHFCQVAHELGLSLDDAAQEWVLLNSQGFEAEWVRNRKGLGVKGSMQPVNKQEALEQRNAEVGRKWAQKPQVVDV